MINQTGSHHLQKSRAELLRPLTSTPLTTRLHLEILSGIHVNVMLTYQPL